MHMLPRPAQGPMKAARELLSWRERVLWTCSSCLISLSQAKDLLTNYQTGVLENSPKMVLLFHLIEESVKLGDKILVFR